MRAASRIASVELPPTSKKLSSTPTRSTSSTSAKRAQTAFSISLSGARPEPRSPKSGAGSAARSSLPLAVSGNASSAMTAAGIM